MGDASLPPAPRQGRPRRRTATRQTNGTRQTRADRIDRMLQESADEPEDTTPSNSATSDEVLRRLHKWRKLLVQQPSDTRAKRQVFAELTEFVTPTSAPPLPAARRAGGAKDRRPPQSAPPTLPALDPQGRLTALSDSIPDGMDEEEWELFQSHQRGINKAYERRFRLQPFEEDEQVDDRRIQNYRGCLKMMRRRGGGSPKYYSDHRGNLLYVKGVAGRGVH